MSTNKQQKGKPAARDAGEKDDAQSIKGQGDSAIRLNTNPRANENIPDDQKKRAFGKKGGADSEITDGEDG